ncbi:MAG: TolC family protein [Propionivibrio sp.]
MCPLPMRLRCSLPLFVLLALAAGTTTAAGTSDPFDTDLITPPNPAFTSTSGVVDNPCKEHSAQTVYGVLEVVDLALCRNPATREAWANARAQAALVGVARGASLPGLDARVGTARNWQDGNSNTRQNSATLTLSWLLYDFGARDADLENARQLLSAASSSLEATVQNVFLAALQAYYNAQAARAAVIAALESEKASRASLTAAEVRYRVGTGTPADRLQAQTALSQATLNRIQAQGALRTALGTLAATMGLAANQPLRLAAIPETVPPPSFERDVDALIDAAKENRPDLRAAEAQVLAAEASVAATRAAGLPSLSLSAGPNWVNSGSGGGNFDGTSGTIGLTLSIPIFSGFDTTYRVRAAQARAEASGAQRDSLQLQVALDVWSNYQNLTTATQSIRTSVDLLASAEQSARVALGRYKAGVGTILDVLNAQSALANARLQGIQAQLDWNVARAALARAVGALDRRLLDPATGVANTPTP